jgi:hypothetical protein
MDLKLNKSADFQNCRKPEKEKKRKMTKKKKKKQEERRKDVISVNHYS